jgi:hypothetical protein
MVILNETDDEALCRRSLMRAVVEQSLLNADRRGLCPFVSGYTMELYNEDMMALLVGKLGGKSP